MLHAVGFPFRLAGKHARFRRHVVAKAPLTVKIRPGAQILASAVEVGTVGSAFFDAELQIEPGEPRPWFGSRGLHRLRVRFAENHRMGSAFERHGFVRRGLPFGIAGTFGVGVGLVAEGVTPYTVGAAVILVVVGALAWFVPWRSLPEWADQLPPYLWFGAVSLLTTETRTADFGYEPLALLPVLWFALYGTKTRTIVSLVALAVQLILPPLLAGGDIAQTLYEAALWVGIGGFVCMLIRRGVSISTTDPLTGVGNRRAMEESLQAELLRSARFGHELAVALIDLDHFKAYNDSKGHPAGDRLLMRATKAWRRTLRSTDSIFRYGGEEFLVVLPGARADTAIRVMERVRGATPMRQTCSIGVAAWDGDESVAELVRRADESLYKAKGSGRNRTAISPTPYVDLRDRSALRN